MPTKTHQGFQKDLSTVVILSDVVCCIRNPFLTQKYEASTNLLQAPVGCPDPYSLCFATFFGLIKIVWFTDWRLSIQPAEQVLVFSHFSGEQKKHEANEEHKTCVTG